MLLRSPTGVEGGENENGTLLIVSARCAKRRTLDSGKTVAKQRVILNREVLCSLLNKVSASTGPVRVSKGAHALCCNCTKEEAVSRTGKICEGPEVARHRNCQTY